MHYDEAHHARRYRHVARIMPVSEWDAHYEFVAAIESSKRRRNAIVLAHNYQRPEIFHGVADIQGDSLALARYAAQSDAEVIVMCGVHFMAETVEALRGAGARLIDDAGTSIMQGIHPLGELAPRDVVARAIYAVQMRGRGVWLDATHLVETDVAEGFPSAYKACRAHGFDPQHEPIPVTPAAHYHMGGIAVDLDGRASLPGLWAIGEAACTGLHGANRLASNSLLEAVVFGRRLGRALDRAPSRRMTVGALCEDHGELPDPACEHALREILWRCMGLIRSGVGLAEGLTSIAQWREKTPSCATLWHARLLLAKYMLLAAARRGTSCGAHYIVDDDALDCASASHSSEKYGNTLRNTGKGRIHEPTG